MSENTDDVDVPITGGGCPVTAYSFKIDPRRKAQLRLKADVHTQIANAMEDASIGPDQSVRTTKMKPPANVTLETLSDRGFDLDRDVLIFVVPGSCGPIIRQFVAQLCRGARKSRRRQSAPQATAPPPEQGGR